MTSGAVDDAAERAERARRLRAALDGVELTPDATSDDVAESASSLLERRQRDQEFEANRPPHHG